MTLRNVPQKDARDQAFIHGIIEHGHMVLCVADAVDEPTEGPPFAYSVGAFESYGAPEVIVSGLGADLMHFMINEFMRAWKTIEKPTLGVRLSGYVEGFDVICVEASKDALRTHATHADWYNQRRPLPLWQMVWSGAATGEFPWEAEADDSLLELQENLTGRRWSAWNAPAAPRRGFLGVMRGLLTRH
jgi:hypothetical protein